MRAHFHVFVLVPVHVCALVCVLVCVGINLLNMALRVFMSDMAIMLLIPKDPTIWRENSKDLPHERGCVKSAENLSASPFKRET